MPFFRQRRLCLLHSAQAQRRGSARGSCVLNARHINCTRVQYTCTLIPPPVTASLARCLRRPGTGAPRPGTGRRPETGRSCPGAWIALRRASEPPWDEAALGRADESSWDSAVLGRGGGSSQGKLRLEAIRGLSSREPPPLILSFCEIYVHCHTS